MNRTNQKLPYYQVQIERILVDLLGKKGIPVHNLNNMDDIVQSAHYCALCIPLYEGIAKTISMTAK